MASKFDVKIARWERMKEITEQAADNVYLQLFPLLKEYGFCGGEIIEIAPSRENHIRVSYTDHRSGGPCYEEIRIPREVWDSDDPISAAMKHKAEMEIKRAAADRARKLAEIDRLTKQLAGEP